VAPAVYGLLAAGLVATHHPGPPLLAAPVAVLAGAAAAVATRHLWPWVLGLKRSGPVAFVACLVFVLPVWIVGLWLGAGTLDDAPSAFVREHALAIARGYATLVAATACLVFLGSGRGDRGRHEYPSRACEIEPRQPTRMDDPAGLAGGVTLQARRIS
jgi:hypothetical protein